MSDATGMPAQAGLAVRDVTVRYGTLRTRGSAPEPAVRNASFDVAEGEVIALTGPSGCGKSTLLRAIAGLEPLESGAVYWSGENLSVVPPHQRGFGLMFQDGQLFAHMTVAKNVGYGLTAKHGSKGERAERVAAFLDLVGLRDYGARSVTELSGGERQRVALARSLAPQPRLLMLDEPLSALDRGLRDHLAAEIAELLRTTRTTAILVTHDLEEAASVADRVLRMRAGEVIHE